MPNPDSGGRKRTLQNLVGANRVEEVYGEHRVCDRRSSPSSRFDKAWWERRFRGVEPAHRSALSRTYIPAGIPIHAGIPPVEPKPTPKPTHLEGMQPIQSRFWKVHMRTNVARVQSLQLSDRRARTITGSKPETHDETHAQRPAFMAAGTIRHHHPQVIYARGTVPKLLLTALGGIIAKNQAPWDWRAAEERLSCVAKQKAGAMGDTEAALRRDWIICCTGVCVPTARVLNNTVHNIRNRAKLAIDLGGGIGWLENEIWAQYFNALNVSNLSVLFARLVKSSKLSWFCLSVDAEE